MNCKRKKLIIALIITFICPNITLSASENQDKVTEEIASTTNKENIKQSKYEKRQKDAVIRMKREYADGNFTFANPYIKVNPYLYNNLSALVIFNSDEKVKYEYTVNGNVPFTYKSDTYVKGNVVIPIVALYEATANDVTIKITNEDGKVTKQDVVITTEESPSNYSDEIIEEDVAKGMGLSGAVTGKSAATDTVTTTFNDPSAQEYWNNNFLVSENYDVYDKDGKLRFSSPTCTGNESLKFVDGLFNAVYDNIMYRVDALGQIHAVYYPPVNIDGKMKVEFHHDSVYDDQGNLYALMGLSGSDIKESGESGLTSESIIVRYDADGGKPNAYFDLTNVIDGEKRNSIDSDRDYLHLNSIDYDKNTGNLIVSSKGQSSISSINFDKKKINWMIQDPSMVTDETKKYQLTVTTGEKMSYTSGNHAAFIMNTDKYKSNSRISYISVFNNNACRDDDGNLVVANKGDKDPQVCKVQGQYSSMKIYKVDNKTKSVNLEEEIIPDKDLFSQIRSSVFTNHDGIYEITYADVNENGEINSTFLVTDEQGKVLSTTKFEGLGNVYRARFIGKDEVSMGLDKYNQLQDNTFFVNDFGFKVWDAYDSVYQVCSNIYHFFV